MQDCGYYKPEKNESRNALPWKIVVYGLWISAITSFDELTNFLEN